MPRTSNSRNSRGGYVLVMLLAASAVVLVTLAMALPRMAVQSQRVKEEMLIYRGKQYERAIKLYFREHKKYPEDFDDLEDTNGVRYLRNRYKDPLTGEDQWRIVRMGKDGRFKDSLIYDQAEETEGDGFGSPFGNSSGSSGFGSNSSQYRPPSQMPMPGQFQGGARTRAVRQSGAPDQTEQTRYNQGYEFSAGTQPGGEGQGQQPALGPDGQPVPQQPDYSATLPSQVPMYENQPPQPNPNAPFGQQGQQQAGQPLYGAGAAQGQFPNMPGQQPLGGTGGTPAAFGQQGVGVGATNIIQRLLTTPRPGGLAGLQGGGQQQQGGMAGGAAAFQEGIAGVASMVEDYGVMTYLGREMYNEWEFVYDYRKDTGAAGGAAMGGMGGVGLAAGQPGASAARGLSMNPGMVGGISPQGQQGRTNPAGISGQNPGTSNQPGYGYGAQPGGNNPYQQRQGGYNPNQPAGNSPYQPTGVPSPYGTNGTTPGTPTPYGAPTGPGQPPLPNAGPSPYQPPGQNNNRRGR